ncbi:hypothetical protein FQA39_LY17496 [Lamprigera yunnana]|nr:hypothetical protein FQA39_LY17496 [Lamprigera yunnana]
MFPSGNVIRQVNNVQPSNFKQSDLSQNMQQFSQMPIYQSQKSQLQMTPILPSQMQIHPSMYQSQQSSGNIRGGSYGEEPIAGPSRTPLDRYDVSKNLSRFFKEIDSIDNKSKRLWTEMLSNLKHLLKKMKTQKIPIDSPLTYKSFVELLKSEELYMTLYITKMNIEQMSQLEDVLKMEANATCSSLPGIPTTCKSSMIVHTPKTDAGVQELTPSGDVTSQIEALFGLTKLETIGGTISQYISINRNGTTNTLRSHSTVGSEVVKLEVYPLKEVIGLPKESWWKKATMRSIFNIPSPVDQTKSLMNQLILKVSQQLIKEGTKKESRKMYSSSGSSNIRQVPY